jgi:uncharacterized membrane protein HdeD (DUF308 family)
MNEEKNQLLKSFKTRKSHWKSKQKCEQALSKYRICYVRAGIIAIMYLFYCNFTCNLSLYELLMYLGLARFRKGILTTEKPTTKPISIIKT